MSEKQIIKNLFQHFPDIRYVALYLDDMLVFQQRDNVTDNSSRETDRFEELLVNPTLLTLASQRGNIDCGGLDYLIIGYGNFYQLVKSTANGHISICLEKSSDITHLPQRIFKFLKSNHKELHIP
ncbi:hypothetical protein [Flagellimonas hymeniacidonis]|uniref:hypothetical protein n=1 Tax=Flagellimonas hymeniacidonis TaxID=2603628 RepID=UPI00165050DD|nr:hypothetical protein [Flagellimonas hymeniacidonis]